MCGIVGIVAPRGGAPVEAAAVTAMRDRLVHRGPDDDGLYVSPDGRVGFGHRRLTIVDLDPRASQPLGNEDGTVWVTFNGEIYNHAELRVELGAAGHRFATAHSDTEVLVHGYEQWGMEGLLARLSGIFAFALHDEGSGRTFIARDHVGVKPLAFARHDGRFVFASELRALRALDGAGDDVDPMALYHYLTFMSAPAPMSLYQGLFKLPAGWYAAIEPDGTFKPAPYWRPPVDALDRTRSMADWVEAVREELIAAVRRQLLADVPIGVFLSGGVDSSALLSIAGKALGEPLDAFSVGFHDHPMSEVEDAARLARSFGARHEVVQIGEEDALAYLPHLVEQQDEPLADWVCIPLHFVSDLARDAGLKVVLVGEGSDEQFCGYDHYLAYLHYERAYYDPVRRFVPGPLGQAGRRLLAAVPSSRMGWLFRRDFIERALAGRQAFWGGAVVFWESMKAGLVADGRGGAMPDWVAGLDAGGLAARDSHAVIDRLMVQSGAAGAGLEPLTRFIALEFAQRLPELLLMRVDKITMASSLEARVPFLDRHLVDLTMRIPSEIKIAGGTSKHILKEAMRGIVPDDILDKPKRGFGAPMREWLGGPLGAHVRDVLADSRFSHRGFVDREKMLRLFDDHVAGRADNAVYVWTLYNLAAWHDHAFPGRA